MMTILNSFFDRSGRCSRHPLLRLIAVLLLAWSVVGLAAVMAERLFVANAGHDPIFPTTGRFTLKALSLPVIGAEAPRPPLERLLSAADRLTKETSVHHRLPIERKAEA